MATHTSLKNLTDISDKVPSEILKDNMIVFLDWSFINAGGFFNINIGSSGAYGGERDNLGPVDDPHFNDGQVWQAIRKNWVWESGTALGTPIGISGVYIDTTFYGIETVGTYAHHYDYPNGRVIFDNVSIATSANVDIEYSYKWINVVDAKSIPWLRANYNSQRVDGSHIDQFGSGDYDSVYTRLDLPCVAVDVPPKHGIRGHELGTGSRYSDNKVGLHVLAEDDSTVVRIADILADQPPKTIHMFDTNQIADSGDFPLDYRGMVNPGAKTFPQLVDINASGGYRWNRVYFADSNNTNYQQLGQNLYISTVVLDTEIILGGV